MKAWIALGRFLAAALLVAATGLPAHADERTLLIEAARLAAEIDAAQGGDRSARLGLLLDKLRKIVAQYPDSAIGRQVAGIGVSVLGGRTLSLADVEQEVRAAEMTACAVSRDCLLDLALTEARAAPPKRSFARASDVLIFVGERLAAAGRIDDATAVFAEAQAVTRQEVPVRVWKLARAQAAAGLYEAAKTTAEMTDDPINALQLHGDVVEAMVDAGRLEEASAYLEWMAATAGSLSDTERMVALGVLAVGYMRTGRRAEAIRLVQRNQDQVYLRHAYVRLAITQSPVDEDLLAAAELVPDRDDPADFSEIAWLLNEAGEHDRARSWARRALIIAARSGLDPEDSNRLVAALADAGEIELARAALVLSADHPDRDKRYSSLSAASARWLEIDTAIELAARIEDGDMRAGALLQGARRILGRDSPAEVAPVLKLLDAVEPEMSQSRRSGLVALVERLSREGRFDEAELQMEELRGSNDESSALYEMAASLAEAGMIEPAMVLFERLSHPWDRARMLARAAIAVGAQQ